MFENFIGKDGFIWWLGVVERRDDPLKLGRHKVRIFGWHTDDLNLIPTDELPWATIIVSPNNTLSFSAIQEGDYVFGFFQDGMSGQSPVIVGVYANAIQSEQNKTKGFSPQGPTKNVPEMPSGLTKSETTSEPQAFDGFTEPESAANTNYQPVYPYNNVTQTPSGHSFELDDTPTRERVRLQHKSGTFLEMHPNGNEVHKIYGKGYTITLGDHNISIGVDGQTSNKCNIVVHGDVNLNVKGDFTQEVDGDYKLHVKGNYKQTVDKITSVTSVGDMKIVAGAAPGVGAVRISAGDHVFVDSDLNVRGEIMATKITSKTRVDALIGMNAGIAGLVTLGGVSVGSITPPIPGSVYSTLSMISPLVMGTNMVYGTVLMDPTGGPPLMRSLYDSHTHISSAPGIPTLLPVPLMPLP